MEKRLNAFVLLLFLIFFANANNIPKTKLIAQDKKLYIGKCVLDIPDRFDIDYINKGNNDINISFIDSSIKKEEKIEGYPIDIVNSSFSKTILVKVFATRNQKQDLLNEKLLQKHFNYIKTIKMANFKIKIYEEKSNYKNLISIVAKAKNFEIFIIDEEKRISDFLKMFENCQRKLVEE